MVRGEALVSGRLRASNQYAESRELPRCQRPRPLRHLRTPAVDSSDRDDVTVMAKGSNVLFARARRAQAKVRLSTHNS
jgi:hypothetical protein